MQITLLVEELSVMSSMPSPQEAVEGNSKRNMDMNFLWNCPCTALKVYSHSPKSSVS